MTEPTTPSPTNLCNAIMALWRTSSENLTIRLGDTGTLCAGPFADIMGGDLEMDFSGDPDAYGADADAYAVAVSMLADLRERRASHA